MSDTETVAPDATAEAAKPELTPEQAAARKLNRALGRALARADGEPGDLKKRWTEGRTKYITAGKKLAKALAKEGVTLTVEPETEKPDETAEA